MSQERNCFEVSSAGEPAYLRTFEIDQDDKAFFVKVSFPGYVQELRERNATRPVSARADENIYVFEDVTSADQLGGMDEDKICQRLAQLPIEALQPYLVEQTIA